MKVHIGKIIQERVREKKMSVSEFGKNLGYTRDGVYKLFQNENINTELLLRINKILDENLFAYFLSKKELVNTSIPIEETINSLKNITTEIISIRKKLASQLKNDK